MADRLYLCQYGNCSEERPPKQSYIVGKPNSLGSPRYCTALHALLGLAREVGIHDEVHTLLHQKGLLK